MAQEMSIEDMAVFCKQKGFIFQSSEIYGGFAGFWDYGPLGVELFNNIKQHWWKHFVHDKEEMVGLDSSIISNPRVWKASGHLNSFGDLIVACTKCKKKFRADHLIEDEMGINVEGMEIPEINRIIRENSITCPECDEELAEIKDFNLLFKTFVGPDQDKTSEAYLRGETAQGMFTDFNLVAESTRKKLPFGIAQIGKCFRNEISPRDFIFRCREFTIGEFEFFIHPEEQECPHLDEEHLDMTVPYLSAETQEAEKNEIKNVTIRELLQEGKMGQWHAYWLAEQIMWFDKLNMDLANFKLREHTKYELSHYSSATFDLDYNYPFGSKEITGNANRGQYDLTQHINESGQNMGIHDDATNQRVVPRVIEPTFGMDRVFLAAIVDAYKDDQERGNKVLHLHPKIAPIKCAVFPLVNKEGVYEKSREVFQRLQTRVNSIFDRSGSIGKRYARQDELGTPFCVTIDYDSLENGDVTLRDRDSTGQVRIGIEELPEVLTQLVNGEKQFSDLSS